MSAPTARRFDSALTEALLQAWPHAFDGAAALVERLSAAIAAGDSCLAIEAASVATVRAWSAVGQGEDDRPLVLDHTGNLYLRRYWQYETAVAAQLSARAKLATAASPALAAALERRFPAHDDDAQHRAATAMLTRGLAIVLGGPGTGKTWTLVRALAALAEAQDAQRPAPRVALAATTGKAAQRLNEGLADIGGALATADGPLRATTVHRLIGMRRDRLQPRHHALAPLPYDLVVVDEASMLDLPLLARLLDALPADTRLVLVGDPDQLASVEAGSVLAELRRVHDDAPHSDVGASVTTLRRAHRFAGGAALGDALDAVRTGDVDALFAALADTAVFEWHEQMPVQPARALASHPWLRALAEAGDSERRLAAFARMRALAALREGRFGVAAINAAQRRARGGRRDGEPVLITANAPALGLANGDVGVFEDGEEPAVCFVAADGGLRRIREHDLPAHEPAWAMTVHKAQGSEFADVAVLLPDPPHRLVTREWLYTALSRARKRVLLLATRAALETAVRTPGHRRSGLRDRLMDGA